MLKTIKFLVLIFLFSTQACVSDIDVDLTDQNSIVLNGILVPGKLVSVCLHRSGINTDTIEFGTIGNAEIILFENGAEREVLHHQGNGVYVSSILVKELSTYKLEVTTSEGEKAWAETTVPEINFGATIQSQPELDSLRNTTWPFYLTIKDNLLYKNFYWVCDKQYEFTPDSIERRSLSFALFTNSLYIDHFNVTYNVEGYGNYYFEYESFMCIYDTEFQGQTISIEFIPQIFSTLKQDSIIVYNMDEHYNNYLKSKIISEQNGAYFSENIVPIIYKPAFLYTNVHGGFGILGSYTTYTKTYTYD